jgi:hypothetical protein
MPLGEYELVCRHGYILHKPPFWKNSGAGYWHFSSAESGSSSVVKGTLKRSIPATCKACEE